jgi:hypothetical protein
MKTFKNFERFNLSEAIPKSFRDKVGADYLQLPLLETATLWSSIKNTRNPIVVLTQAEISKGVLPEMEAFHFIRLLSCEDAVSVAKEAGFDEAFFRVLQGTSAASLLAYAGRIFPDSWIVAAHLQGNLLEFSNSLKEPWDYLRSSLVEVKRCNYALYSARVDRLGELKEAVFHNAQGLWVSSLTLTERPDDIASLPEMLPDKFGNLKKSLGVLDGFSGMNPLQ